MSDYIGTSPNYATTPVQTSTGDGTATPITLNFNPGNAEGIQVFINGIAQTPNINYTVVGLTLTPSSAIPLGYPVLIVYKTIAAQIGVTQASAVVNTPSGTITDLTVQAAINTLDGRSGAKGGGTDSVFFENDEFISQSFTLGEKNLISGANISIASPCLVTLSNHGFVDGSGVWFKTTGALPTGLSVDTGYYVISTGLTANNFQLALTRGGTAIITTGTQSGIHSCGKLKNATSAGTMTIATGVTVTIPTNATWVIG